MMVDNSIVLAAIIDAKENGEMSNLLAYLLVDVATQHLNRPQWQLHLLKQDLIANAVLQLTKSWSMFNPNLSSNPVAFFSQVVQCSALGMLNEEKRARIISETYIEYSDLIVCSSLDVLIQEQEYEEIS
jgi:hypothetical protein